VSNGQLVLSVRQNVREARKPFPLLRGRGEAMIESGVQYKIFPDRIQTAHKFPTAFLLVSGSVKCQSSPAAVSFALLRTCQFSMLTPANEGLLYDLVSIT
jgi:hypothetical protein